MIKASLFRHIVFLMFSASPLASAQSICGSTGLLTQPASSVRGFLDQYGLSVGVPRIQCGLPGEDFRICGACGEDADGQLVAKLKPMLTTPAHRAWHERWHDDRGQLVSAAKQLDPQGQWSAAKCPGWQTRSAPARLQDADDRLEDLGVDAATLARLKSQQKQMRDRELEGARQLAREMGARGDLDRFIKLHNFYGRLSGEDFLFMHRQMLKMISIELTFQGQACIAPWKALPHENDKLWPTTTTRSTADGDTIAQLKRDFPKAHLAMRMAESELHDPAYLRSVSLSELGQCVEGALHGYLHQMYNDRAGSCRGYRDANMTCDDLVPPWSAPMNKHFWKIHGLIDGLIGDWLNAHGYTEIAEKCEGRRGCYEWQEPWLGNMPGRGS